MVEIKIIICPFCHSEYITNDLTKNYYYTCGECDLCFPIQSNNKAIKSKDLVIWIENNKVVYWKPNRTPALGWNTLTLLEALTDSAKTFLSIGKAYDDKSNFLRIALDIAKEIQFPFFSYGFQEDPSESYYDVVYYFEIEKLGQISFHSSYLHNDVPEFPGKWTGIRNQNFPFGLRGVKKLIGGYKSDDST